MLVPLLLCSLVIVSGFNLRICASPPDAVNKEMFDSMRQIYSEKFAYAAIDRIEATAKVFDNDRFVVRTKIVCEGENISSVAHGVLLENACAMSCEHCLRLMVDHQAHW